MCGNHPCVPCNCPPEYLNTLLPVCNDPEFCEQMGFTECIKYQGPNLPALGILNNDRLTTVLTKLHSVVNGLISPTVPIVNITFTSTTTVPFVVTYLGLGPRVVTTPGATNTTNTITVNSTTGIQAGMQVRVVSGVGAVAAGTTVSSITNTTTLVLSANPTTSFGVDTVLEFFGSVHTPYNLTVVQGTPVTVRGFQNSAVIISGTGTIV